jgi:hypothetical protein
VSKGQRVPKGTKRYQKVPKGAKRCQKVKQSSQGGASRRWPTGKTAASSQGGTWYRWPTGKLCTVSNNFAVQFVLCMVSVPRRKVGPRMGPRQAGLHGEPAAWPGGSGAVCATAESVQKLEAVVVAGVVPCKPIGLLCTIFRAHCAWPIRSFWQQNAVLPVIEAESSQCDP